MDMQILSWKEKKKDDELYLTMNEWEDGSFWHMNTNIEEWGQGESLCDACLENRQERIILTRNLGYETLVFGNQILCSHWR